MEALPDLPGTETATDPPLSSVQNVCAEERSSLLLYRVSDTNTQRTTLVLGLGCRAQVRIGAVICTVHIGG